MAGYRNYSLVENFDFEFETSLFFKNLELKRFDEFKENVNLDSKNIYLLHDMPIIFPIFIILVVWVEECCGVVQWRNFTSRSK